MRAGCMSATAADATVAAAQATCAAAKHPLAAIPPAAAAIPTQPAATAATPLPYLLRPAARQQAGRGLWPALAAGKHVPHQCSRSTHQ